MAFIGNLRDFLKVEKSMCMIVAEQDSSEIWINGQRTDYQTPQLIPLPKNKPVLLEVKQLGHEPYQAWVRSSHPKSFHYCDLKRIPLRLIHDENYESPAL